MSYLDVTSHWCTDPDHGRLVARLAPLSIFSPHSAWRQARGVAQGWRFDFSDPAVTYFLFLDKRSEIFLPLADDLSDV